MDARTQILALTEKIMTRTVKVSEVRDIAAQLYLLAKSDIAGEPCGLSTAEFCNLTAALLLRGRETQILKVLGDEL